MPAPTLLDSAVGVATGVISGRYRTTDEALRALGRLARGCPKAEQAAALEAALRLIRAAMTHFEALNPSLSYNPEASEALRERLRSAFPEFSAHALQQAVTWCDLWFCK